MGRVADVLVAASNAANTSVSQMGQALSFAGTLSASLGISLEETAAVIGVFGTAGIQASRAGTGLNAIFGRIAQDTQVMTRRLAEMGLTTDDVNIQVLGLTEVMTRLRDAGLDTNSALALFGRRGGPAAITFSQNIDEVIRLTEELENSQGAAQEMADVIEDTAAGSIRRLQSAIQELQLVLGDSGLLEGLREVTEGLTNVVRILAGGQVTEDMTEIQLGFAAAVEGMGVMIAEFAFFFINTLPDAINDALVAVGLRDDLGNVVRPGSEAVRESVVEGRSRAPELLEDIRSQRAQIAEHDAIQSDAFNAMSDLTQEMEPLQDALNSLRSEIAELRTTPNEQFFGLEALRDEVDDLFGALRTAEVIQTASQTAIINAVNAVSRAPGAETGLSGAAHQVAREENIASALRRLESAEEAATRANQAIAELTTRIAQLDSQILAGERETLEGRGLRETQASELEPLALSLSSQLSTLQVEYDRLFTLNSDLTRTDSEIAVSIAEMVTQLEFISAFLARTPGEAPIPGVQEFLREEQAKGGVWSEGHLQAFARGGVVNGPTTFPFANGIGLMGEAGPEAILPLQRGPNGELGVQAFGSGGFGTGGGFGGSFPSREAEEYATTLRLVVDEQDEVSEGMLTMQRLGDQVGRTLGSTLSSVLTGTESVADAMEGLLRSLTDIAVSTLLTGPLQSFLSSGLSGLFASGGVFSSGRLVPFANGGVVTSPTLFPMAGGAGLMGEAGPEAVMPLSRGVDGSLGVRASGDGGQTIIMNINTPDADSFRKSQPQILNEARKATRRQRRA